MATPKTTPLAIKQLKRSDLVAQEIKRMITERNLSPGDRLPRESELQAQFEVSKGTIREALKSLEVQGLITISTGPTGGGTIAEVPLDRTLQFMQNYLFFQEVTIDDIYTVRQMLEPELAAGAVPHLTEADMSALTTWAAWEASVCTGRVLAAALVAVLHRAVQVSRMGAR